MVYPIVDDIADIEARHLMPGMSQQLPFSKLRMYLYCIIFT
jgi:hypothetical protein